MSNKLNFLDFEEAVKISLNLAKTTTLKEIVPISKALGRIVSSDVICKKNLPSFNNSAMDGFAFKIADSGKTLKIKKVIFAGDKGSDVEAILNEGECYKIMTGAKVPSDVDTIIPIENCIDANEKTVTLPNDLKVGSNLRLKGEEQKEGNVLFKKGEVINSSHITLLASQGLMMIEVFKQISIAVVSTGNELKEPWEEANEEEIYNCNSYALVSLLEEAGFCATYSGVVPDNLEESINFISNLKTFDVIITTGGISMGDADFVGEAFVQNGLQTAFHGVNVKPGRPIMMGSMESDKKQTFVMCLPGNPLTAMVNMQLFAIPVLNKIQGNSGFYHDVVIAKNQESFKTKKGRVNLVLGNCENGGFNVTRNNKYGSGMITALYESNCILVTSENTAGVEAEQMVKLIKFNNKFLSKTVNIFN
ncbi:molybdopterin molybdotransferase MoeA [Poseidonibacter ostreae]|jgi:molybdopterin molybdotransferase|uniref:Molybdopterin molybdenumtransferase n=1 Tax=Poseidonibacter ostreae TaxID=2654171 RepID=A0A6L4WRR3_9BACT|nr:molybdopterin molybdotransferase MoeA [Poseidonibacter ostreae]KAB7887784.1 molybdopterin molybdenumtransferase MoeA [Poseidonibacter ostreae]KAB7890953.1 molybdopterin molybdenumtransferase MoeA [Poseidonibacter ostreae]MAC84385.1 molybdopterin molybdenumtransferase MoeA [Arcobacter sp.]|tara:strand:+ start:160 stop:1419 length:1260 start_codon:yes stop_codon:yes gene_type:complete